MGGGGGHEKPKERGELPKNGGAWAVCRFTGGGVLGKKVGGGAFEGEGDIPMHAMSR